MAKDFPYDPTQVAVPILPGVEAVVIDGKVTADDTGGLFATDTDPGIFVDYEIHSYYENDPHVYMMGLTSPGGFQGASVAFVQLASPTLLLVSDWTAAKWNTIPEFPDIAMADGDWVLLNRWHKTVSVTFAADGVTPLYRLEGTYVYGHKNPPADIVSLVAFPRPPWALDTGVQRGLSSELYTGNTLDAAGGNTSSLSTVNPITNANPNG